MVHEKNNILLRASSENTGVGKPGGEPLKVLVVVRAVRVFITCRIARCHRALHKFPTRGPGRIGVSWKPRVSTSRALCCEELLPWWPALCCSMLSWSSSTSAGITRFVSKTNCCSQPWPDISMLDIAVAGHDAMKIVDIE
jgi:hypothetical protein